MILEFDLGNSRSKWRLRENLVGNAHSHPKQLTTARGVMWELNAEALTAIGANRTISDIRVASVADGATERRLSALCQQTLKLSPWFARTQQKIDGFDNNYIDAKQLGVDRWLASLAAFRLSGDACFVIDAGTALTLDYVSEHGVFLGGSITPGIYMMRQALQSSTKRVRFAIDEKPDQLAPGTSTALAVAHGSYIAFDGAIVEALRLAKQTFGSRFTIFTTGGDANRCHKLLKREGHTYLHKPELVLDGLHFADLRAENGKTEPEAN